MTTVFSVPFFTPWYLHVSVSNHCIMVASWQKYSVGTIPQGFAEEVAEWLQGYFKGEEYEHRFSLQLPTTKFRVAVYRSLLASRYGDTMTYAELAQRAGYPRAQRAVGTALRCNTLPVFIPCHRVLSASGLGGYTPGLEIKKQLLALESLNCRF